MAGGVAHDFNNLLTTIIGYTELMLATLRQAVGEQVDMSLRAGSDLSGVRIGSTRRQQVV